MRLKRSGTFAAFERRYNPDPTLFDDFRNLPAAHKQAAEKNRFWTVTDDDGTLFVNPGVRYVNRLGYMITERPYDEQETRNTPYVYV